jgi:sorbitol/mannitol transport system substrate-binding protein
LDHRFILRSPQVWSAGQVQARSFGIPIQPTVDVLGYRKDRFDRLGLQPPRTFAEATEVSETAVGAT